MHFSLTKTTLSVSWWLRLHMAEVPQIITTVVTNARFPSMAAEVRPKVRIHAAGFNFNEYTDQY